MKFVTKSFIISYITLYVAAPPSEVKSLNFWANLKEIAKGMHRLLIHSFLLHFAYLRITSFLLPFLISVKCSLK